VIAWHEQIIKAYGQHTGISFFNPSAFVTIFRFELRIYRFNMFDSEKESVTKVHNIDSHLSPTPLIVVAF
jgi:hypothetical protein